MPQELLALADAEGIIVLTWDFKPPVEALYLSIKGKHFIAIAYSVLADKRYLRCVLAEELGHHFTTAWDCRPKKILRYKDRLRISKEEYKARKWAAQFLMPFHELEKAIRNGIHEVWDLADHFCVTEDMVKFRLELPDIAPLRNISVK